MYEQGCLAVFLLIIQGGIMRQTLDSPNIRKGRFLWMERNERELFINDLKIKIAQGYYFSDSIFSKIAEELTPVMADTFDDS